MEPVILIAAQASATRDSFQRFFTKKGFRAEIARDGLDCLEKLPVLEPDALILDMNVPWGGGDGVIARVNEGMCRGKKPAILVLGDASRENLAGRTGVPQSRCFQRTIAVERLTEAVYRAVLASNPRSEDSSDEAEAVGK